MIEEQDQNPATSMIVLLLAATVSVDLLATAQFRAHSSTAFTVGGEYARVAFFSLVFAQWFLLCLWLCLGTSYWLLRFPGTGVGVACLTFTIIFIQGESDYARMATMNVILMIPFLLLFFVIRCLGFRWGAPDSEDSKHHDKPRMQFTLARMFGWMTIVAFLALLVHYARLDDISIMAIIATMLGPLLFAVILSLAVWMALLRGPLVARWGGWLAIIFLLSLIITSILPGSPSEALGYVFMTLAISSLFVAAWVEALKTVGITIHRVGGRVAREVETVTQQAETVSTQAPEGIDTDREGPN